MRKTGLSIKEIATRLQVSRGSVSIWCRDVDLSVQQRKHLKLKQIAAGHKGRLIGAEMNRRKKELEVQRQKEEASVLISHLSKRDRLMLGIGLYWGEGVKADTSATALVNSDPEIVKFAKSWFLSLGVQEEDLSPYVYLPEAHRGRERQVVKFWSFTLALPPSRFRQIIYLQGSRKKLYENHNSYYGIVALRVRKGTSLKYLIRGLIECCKSLA